MHCIVIAVCDFFVGWQQSICGSEMSKLGMSNTKKIITISSKLWELRAKTDIIASWHYGLLSCYISVDCKAYSVFSFSWALLTGYWYSVCFGRVALWRVGYELHYIESRLASDGFKTCDFVGYRQCISEFRQLSLRASLNPDLYFSGFCRSATLLLLEYMYQHL